MESCIASKTIVGLVKATFDRNQCRAGSTTFGALGENFKWGLFIIKY